MINTTSIDISEGMRTRLDLVGHRLDCAGPIGPGLSVVLSRINFVFDVVVLMCVQVFRTVIDRQYVLVTVIVLLAVPIHIRLRTSSTLQN